jgi:hypothetical protein
MTTTEDILADCFQASFNLQEAWYNNSQFNLIVQGNRVVTNDFIPAGSYIGEIFGKHSYSWDVPVQSPYIIQVDDDYVIDGTQAPRCILTMIRNAFYIGMNENCILQITNEYEDEDCKIAMISMTDIFPDQELFY